MAKKTQLEDILKYWAADREGVSSLNVLSVEFDFDQGWPGTDVTPGEPPEVVIKYKIEKEVVYRHPVNELGEFIAELSQVASRGPL